MVRENRFVCYFVWLASEVDVSRGIKTSIVLVFGSGGINLKSVVIRPQKSFIAYMRSSSRVREIIRVIHTYITYEIY